MTTSGEFVQWVSANIQTAPSLFGGERKEWREMMEYQLFDFWLKNIH